MRAGSRRREPWAREGSGFTLLFAPEDGSSMDIIRAGSHPSGKGPAEYFTGTVRIDPLNAPPEPARVSMALVTFEPGARTAWHTPARADAHRHRRMRPGAARGWPDRGNPPWRRCVVPTRGEALARGRAGHGNEPHSHPGKAERLAGGLDGARPRSATRSPRTAGSPKDGRRLGRQGRPRPDISASSISPSQLPARRPEGRSRASPWRLPVACCRTAD